MGLDPEKARVRLWAPLKNAREPLGCVATPVAADARLYDDADDEAI
jgi:hypothetical protein